MSPNKIEAKVTTLVVEVTKLKNAMLMIELKSEPTMKSWWSFCLAIVG